MEHGVRAWTAIKATTFEPASVDHDARFPERGPICTAIAHQDCRPVFASAHLFDKIPQNCLAKHGKMLYAYPPVAQRLSLACFLQSEASTWVFKPFVGLACLE